MLTNKHLKFRLSRVLFLARASAKCSAPLSPMSLPGPSTHQSFNKLSTLNVYRCAGTTHCPLLCWLLHALHHTVTLLLSVAVVLRTASLCTSHVYHALTALRIPTMPPTLTSNHCPHQPLSRHSTHICCWCAPSRCTLESPRLHALTC